MRRFQPVCLPALFAVSALAHADTLYTNAAAYNGAASTKTTINFNGIAPSGGFVQQSNPFTLSGSTFTFSPNANASSLIPATTAPLTRAVDFSVWTTTRPRTS